MLHATNRTHLWTPFLKGRICNLERAYVHSSFTFWATSVSSYERRSLEHQCCQLYTREEFQNLKECISITTIESFYWNNSIDNFRFQKYKLIILPIVSHRAIFCGEGIKKRRVSGDSSNSYVDTCFILPTSNTFFFQRQDLHSRTSVCPLFLLIVSKKCF